MEGSWPQTAHLCQHHPTWHQAVPSVPQGNAVSMEIFLSCAMNFEVNMHLPVLEEARLEGEQRGLSELPRLAYSLGVTQHRPWSKSGHSEQGQAAGSQVSLMNRSPSVSGGKEREATDCPKAAEAQTPPTLAPIFSRVGSHTLTHFP